MKFHRTRSLALVLAVGASATTGVAEASTDNYLEMQINSLELSHIIRTRLQTGAEFCPHSVPCPGSSGLCFVDRVDFPSVGQWTRGGPTQVTINGHTTISTTEILYEQPVVAHVKTPSCTYTPGCQTTTAYAGEMTVQMTGSQGSSLCFSPSAPTGLPFSVNHPVDPFCVELDLSAAEALTGNANTTVTGRAVSLQTGGSRVAFRFELDRGQSAYDSTRVDAWESFVDGQLANGNSSHDWSLFAHESLLRASAQKHFQDGIASSPELSLIGSPVTTWTGLGASGGQISLFTGAEYDDCVDISPLTLTAQTSLNGASNGLDTQGTLTWDVDEWDAAWCGFLDGFVVGAIAGPIIAASIDLQDLGQSVGACQVTGDHTFACAQETHPQLAVLGHGWSLKSFLSSVYGHSNGLVLSGNMVQIGSGIPDIDVSLQTPSFGYRGTCNSAECGYLGGVYLSGNAKLCGVEFTNDPLNVFVVEPPASLDLPAYYDVRVDPTLSDTVKSQYIASPYGMNVTVFSSSGISTHTFAPTELFPVGTNNLAHDEAFVCKGLQIKHWATGCLKPKWRPGEQKFHPEWVIDPWDHVVIIWDDFTGVELGIGLAEQMNLRAIWDRYGRRIAGISVSGIVQIPKEDGVANTQSIQIDAMLPRGVTARSLREAVVLGFRSGLTETIAVDSAFVPTGATRASFEMFFDQSLLLDMAGR